MSRRRDEMRNEAVELHSSRSSQSSLDLIGTAEKSGEPEASAGVDDPVAEWPDRQEIDLLP